MNLFIVAIQARLLICITRRKLPDEADEKLLPESLLKLG